MRTGPGASGRSASPRVSVSESRIDPPQLFLPRQRGEHCPELGAALAPGEHEPQCAQVAADGLQLPYERFGLEVDELAKPKQRLGRDLGGWRCLQDRTSVVARFVQVAGPSERRCDR